MKRYLLLAIVASAFISRADAQPKDSAGSTNRFPLVVENTNQLSTKDLQDFLQINSWNFDVHLASVTNGVNVSLDIKEDGGKTQTVLTKMLRSRSPIAYDGVDTNLNVILVISPVGTMDGTGYLEAKQLRTFFKLPMGTFGPGLIPNPFFKSEGMAACLRNTYANSTGEITLLEGDSGSGSPKQDIKLVVRFEQF